MSFYLQTKIDLQDLCNEVRLLTTYSIDPPKNFSRICKCDIMILGKLGFRGWYVGFGGDECKLSFGNNTRLRVSMWGIVWGATKIN